MSVSNEAMKSLHIGDNVTRTFAIGFQFTPQNASAEIKVYYVDENDEEVLAIEGDDQDYVLDPPYDSNTNPDGPANVIFRDDVSTIPTDEQRVSIRRELPLTQPETYIGTGPIPSRTLQRNLDRITFMIQQLNDIASRAFTLAASVEGQAGGISLPTPGVNSVLYSADGVTFSWLDVETISGVPAGGAIGAFLGKASAADFDIAWDDLALSGYSSRFSANFTINGIRDAIEQIMAFVYTAPGITLSASGSSTVREKGTVVAGTTLTAAITKRSNPIGEVRFYVSPSTLLDTQTSGGGIPSGGNSTYVDSTNFSDTKAFFARVDDTLVGSDQTIGTQSNTVTFTFVYPYYSGVGAAGLTAAQVAALTKDVRVSTASLAKSFSPNGSQVLYFAYPASYGALTSILDVNNFNTIGDWTQRTEDITGLDGNPVSYYIYEFNNVPLAGTYQYTFVR